MELHHPHLEGHSATNKEGIEFIPMSLQLFFLVLFFFVCSFICLFIMPLSLGIRLEEDKPEVPSPRQEWTKPELFTYGYIICVTDFGVSYKIHIFVQCPHIL